MFKKLTKVMLTVIATFWLMSGPVVADNKGKGCNGAPGFVFVINGVVVLHCSGNTESPPPIVVIIINGVVLHPKI